MEIIDVAPPSDDDVTDGQSVDLCAVDDAASVGSYATCGGVASSFAMVNDDRDSLPGDRTVWSRASSAVLLHASEVKSAIASAAAVSAISSSTPVDVVAAQGLRASDVDAPSSLQDEVLADTPVGDADDVSSVTSWSLLG